MCRPSSDFPCGVQPSAGTVILPAAARRRHGPRPPRGLKAGDTVTIEIEKIGVFDEPVVEEQMRDSRVRVGRACVSG